MHSVHCCEVIQTVSVCVSVTDAMVCLTLLGRCAGAVSVSLCMASCETERNPVSPAACPT